MVFDPHARRTTCVRVCRRPRPRNSDLPKMQSHLEPRRQCRSQYIAYMFWWQRVHAGAKPPRFCPPPRRRCHNKTSDEGGLSNSTEEALIINNSLVRVGSTVQPGWVRRVRD